MHLDAHGGFHRRGEKYQRHQQKAREMMERNKNAYVFQKMMNTRIKAMDETLRRLESRINEEVEQRVAVAVQNIMESDLIQNVIVQRVKAILETTQKVTTSPENPDSTDSEDTESIGSGRSLSEVEAEPSCSPSCSSPQEQTPHYPNKWEFITCLEPSGQVTDFRMEQFTEPVRSSLKLSADQEIFPRMSLEEQIERDHPTTSDSETFDEKKITCRTRRGKSLTDEEFFCLAPCCSDMRLNQVAVCPFLPQFVRNRLNKEETCRLIVKRTQNGIEFVTPIKWHLVQPVIPRECPEEEEREPEEEEEDPLQNPDVVEQLMREYFLPTPPIPIDDMVFGPYLQRVREADVLPKSLLHDLLKRVNSNLDNSYKNHQELELYAELDKVPVDEKYGRLPF